MSTLTALARALAVDSGTAQPITTVRHLHVHDRPLVVVPLTLAGEANAPLAAMLGTSLDAGRLLVVPQPRNRDQRFAFAAEFAGILLSYVDLFATSAEQVSVGRGDEVRLRYANAPQVIVPNRGGIDFLRLFGRSTRFRRTDGEWPVAASVPLLGRWLTFLAERFEYPGSAALLAMTEALAAHWATGQSALEDANLATFIGWIDPPNGLTGPEAAAAAEDPLLWPPAGPATDPTFDNEILAPLINGYGQAVSEAEYRQALAALRRALHGQIEPTWRLMWHAVHLLRAVPPGARVAGRWDRDRDAYTTQVTHLAEGGPPQPRRDSAVAAAGRLNQLERAQAAYEVQQAFDDPLVLAEYRLTGEAFAGEVTATQPDRVVDNGRRRVLRPRIAVRTVDPVRLAPGTTVTAPARPNQKGTIITATADNAGRTEVVLELAGGMGRRMQPEPGTVPEVGEHICYTTLTDTFQPAAPFPPRDQTPWTHGGPPPEYVATNEDATEEWS